MTKLVKIDDSNNTLESVEIVPFLGGSLDTLAQLPQNDIQSPILLSKEELLKYSKRARSKYLTRSYLFKLIDLHSSLEKSYWHTYYCGSNIQQTGSKLISQYCNQRWCLTCNRIRIAKAINAYKYSIDNFVDPIFLTLTNQNCKEEELYLYITEMLRLEHNARQTVNRKSKKKIQGIRKLECTYNPFTDTYNPHFHFIMEGVNQAEILIEQWIKQNIKAGIEISAKAQDIQECDDKSITELFKYFTKLVSSKGGFKRYTTSPALDNIFQAMKGRRVYQPIGGLKKKQVTEEVDTLQSEILENVVANLENDIWLWSENDWVSQSTGSKLSGYNPSDYDKAYSDLIYTKRKT